jgi:hypothetical protein
MPITYRVDHARRVVWAEGHGTLTDDDLFGYQREVWSRGDVAGYGELMDMRGVEHIAETSPVRIRELAALAATLDPSAPRARFAIVAPDDLAFGLGRMYEAYRSFQPASTKQVGVFRSLDDALAFLGVEPDPRA